MRLRPLLIAAGLAMADLMPSPALSAGPREPEWQVRQSSAGVVLAHEVADTDNQTLFMGCDAGSGRLNIRLRYDRDRLPEGMTAPVTFASQSTRFVIPMRAERQELDDELVLLATTPLSSPLLEVLRGEMLLIGVGGENSHWMSLEGAAPGVAAFEARCASR